MAMEARTHAHTNAKAPEAEAGGEGAEGRSTVDATYWIDRETWPSCLALLLLVSLALLLALPYGARVGELTEGALQPNRIFPVVYVIVYGIVAVTLGQAEARALHPPSWGGRWRRLLARQALAVGLTLPHWTAFLAAYVLPFGLLVGLVLQLLLYGLVLGLFGWRLALMDSSDLVQFNVKYLALVLLWVGSLFVPGLIALNPFGMVERWLSGTPEPGGVVVSGGLWLGLAAALSAWTRRAVRRRSEGRGF